MSTPYSVAWRFALVVLSGTAALQACTVPVFRYALERWPPDAHIVNVTSNVFPEAGTRAVDHHANFWIERAPQDQTTDVAVAYADDPSTWYEGPWQPGLLTRLADSPLRRRIAHELVTGSTAVFVLIESDNAASNAAVFAMLEQALARLEKEIELEEEPDYEDEADDYSGPGAGQALGTLQLQLAFALHRVSRTDEREAYFLRQITALDAEFASPATPAVAIIFGQGRMIPLAGPDLVPEAIGEVCWFLCSACSCRVKALNPGIDLLMAANWDEAVYAYPDGAATILPDGSEFDLGGTGRVATAAVDSGIAERSAAPPAQPARRGSGHTVWVLAVAAIGILVLVGAMLIRKP